jgi:hypothetical protein
MAIAAKKQKQIAANILKSRHKKCIEKCSVVSEAHFYLSEKLTFT